MKHISIQYIALHCIGLRYMLYFTCIRWYHALLTRLITGVHTYMIYMHTYITYCTMHTDITWIHILRTLNTLRRIHTLQTPHLSRALYMLITYIVESICLNNIAHITYTTCSTYFTWSTYITYAACIKYMNKFIRKVHTSNELVIQSLGYKAWDAPPLQAQTPFRITIASQS